MAGGGGVGGCVCGEASVLLAGWAVQVPLEGKCLEPEKPKTKQCFLNPSGIQAFPLPALNPEPYFSSQVLK